MSETGLHECRCGRQCMGRPAPSPLPWTVIDKSVRVEEWDNHLRVVADLDNVKIWCAKERGGSYQENRANAELIVKAVTSYADRLALVEELFKCARLIDLNDELEKKNAAHLALIEELTEALQGMLDDPWSGDMQPETTDTAEKALAKSRALLGGGA